MALRRHVIRRVTIFEVAGPLGDVVQDLDNAIQSALTTESRGVVCDLTSAVASDQRHAAEPGAVEALASIGRHVRDWPAIPIAIASPDPQIREALRTHRVGCHLIVTAAMLTGITSMLATHPGRPASGSAAARLSRYSSHFNVEATHQRMRNESMEATE